MTKTLAAAIVCAAIAAHGAGLNVKDFGARGDGIADDTAAFTAAGAEAEAEAFAAATRWGNRNRENPSGSLEGPRREIFVPNGRYRIASTILLCRDAYIRGEDGATLVGGSPTNDILYVASAYRVRVENLSFVGGRHQLRPETFNNESANIRIVNCRFSGSAAEAVHSLSFKTEGAKRGCGAWNYDRQTGRFSPNVDYVPEKLVANNHSTMFVIDGCTFDGCASAVAMCPDGSVVRDCIFNMPRGATNAALRVSNMLHGCNLRFSHYAGSAAIESRGRLTLWLEGSSVTTPDGSGARVLFGPTMNKSQSSIVVMQDVKTDAGLAKGNAICRFEGSFPAVAALVRVTAEGTNEVAAFAFGPEETEKAFDESRRIKAWEVNRFFSYGVRGCSANVSLPKGYAKRFVREVPEWAAVGRVPAAVDHSPAGKRRVSEGRWHTISNTVVVNRDMTFDASGVAAFEGMPPDRPWFVVKNGARLVLRNLQMRGGSSFVVVEPGGKAFVDSCFSYDCEGAVFRCERGGRLEVDCGVYYAARLYEGAGDATIRSIWYRYTEVVPWDKPIPSFAAIVNKGRLTMWDVLGVPTVFGRFPKSLASAEPKTRYDIRWVDNHGDYNSRMFRYGGEWGGVPAVFHFGKGASTLVEGGYAWYWNRSVAAAPIVADSPDAAVRMFGVALPQYRKYLPRIDLMWRDDRGMDHVMQKTLPSFTNPAAASADESAGGCRVTIPSRCDSHP